jgi:hypothetical protein
MVGEKCPYGRGTCNVMCVDFDRSMSPSDSIKDNCVLDRQYRRYAKPSQKKVVTVATTRRKSGIQTTPDGKFQYSTVPLVNGDKISLVSNDWYCWVEGKSAPKTGHTDEATARKEAARLAALEPGTVVHVMQMVFRSVASCEVAGVSWQ